MWNALLIWIGFRSRPEPFEPETGEDLIRVSGEIRELLRGLGYNPCVEMESGRILAELKSSIRAEIGDYEAFRSAVASAVLRSRSMPAGSFALLDSLSAAPDQQAAQAILNADPVGGQVPFIEQIPVVKGGQLTWRSPMDHSLIRRRPADLPRFLKNIDDLERLFFQPQPARSETLRLEVQGAIVRLRRELERDKSYLPTPLQFLETKLAEYGTKSRRTDAAELAQKLLAAIDRLAELRNALRMPDGRETWQLAGRVAEQAGLYLATPGIQTPWLTNRILGLSLHPRLMSATGQRAGKRNRQKMELIRREVAAGYYDAAETSRRLHSMESSGFDVLSLVYPLLRLHSRGGGGDP